MFIRYTHFGIGHPAMLHRIIKDCLGFESPGNAMDIVSDDNEADMGREEDSDGEGEGDEGCSDDDDGEVSDEEFSDEGNEKDDGWEGGEDEDEHEGEDDDLPSF
jgi:hypothetical protein